MRQPLIDTNPSCQFGDYVFHNATLNALTPLQGFTQLLANSTLFPTPPALHFAQGCELWSNDESQFPEALAAARASDVAVVMVGTWSLDQTLLWTPGTNATTGEHVDLSSLALVGAQRKLVEAIVGTGTPTVVVFVSGKPVAEPWIASSKCALHGAVRVLTRARQTWMRSFSSSTTASWAGSRSPRSCLEWRTLLVRPQFCVAFIVEDQM